MRRWLALLIALLTPLALAAPSQAFEEPATGDFSMTTAPGILPAWSSAGITIAGIAPASVTTTRFATDATVTLPVVARAQSANATAGGFRITNIETGASVRCQIPTIDTKALVVDCLTTSGYNTALFSIENIATRQAFASSTNRTTIFQGMDLKLTSAGALALNRELGTTVFTTSVRVATGDLTVTRAR